VQATVPSPETYPSRLAPNRPSSPASIFEGAPGLETSFRGTHGGGRIRVAVGRGSDARELGYPAVFGAASPDLPYENGAAMGGFPVLLAQVEPESRGYENWFGWIQLVNEREPNGRPISSEHDPIWFLNGKDIPYCALGYAPTFFDAPSRPARRAVLWEADLFLCTVPANPPKDSRTLPPVEPLAGLRWGFRIDTDGGEPVALTPRWTGDWAWASWVPVLRKGFPGWSFADRTPSVAFTSVPRVHPPT
jgi:hypothetical protein